MFARFNTVLTLSIFLGISQAEQSPFIISNPDFNAILGPNPKLTVLLNTTLPLFHEAGVYHPSTKSLFCVTDTINDPSIENNKTIQLLNHITNLGDPANVKYNLLTNLTTLLPNPTGSVPYLREGANQIAILATGDDSKDHGAAGVYLMNPYAPFNITPLTTSYGLYPYNSPNDVTAFPDGSLYFTDPVYGFEAGKRGPPYLPNQVYRYDPKTNTTRAIADGFGRPNGITHSPDGSTLYVSDTGASIGNGTTDNQGQRSTYAYDVVTISGSPFATSRRVFAMPETGANDGLKTDTKGNVWGFTLDGLHVWNAGGELLGKILLDGGTGNFGFAESGVIYVLGSTLLYKLEVAGSVIGTGVFP
jgi:gluconolactonase